MNFSGIYGGLFLTTSTRVVLGWIGGGGHEKIPDSFLRLTLKRDETPIDLLNKLSNGRGCKVGTI